jgi:hypothetical protein
MLCSIEATRPGLYELMFWQPNLRCKGNAYIQVFVLDHSLRVIYKFCCFSHDLVLGFSLSMFPSLQKRDMREVDARPQLREMLWQCARAKLSRTS